MRKFPLFLIIATLLLAVTGVSCLDSNDGNDTWEEYADWRNANDGWLEEMRQLTDVDGNSYYRTVRGPWDHNSFVLMHYFNDTTLTRGNLSPHFNSYVDVIYRVTLYDGTPIDSSYLQTSPADSVYRTSPQNEITGWVIALTDMHVGDSCEVIVPYSVGYGANGSGDILPYSHLVYSMKLVGVPFYETKP